MKRTGGCHIALMGIDGAGKTSVSAKLQESLRRSGHEVQVVTWKQAMNGNDALTASILSDVSVLAYKYQYFLSDASDDVKRLLCDPATRTCLKDTEKRLQSAVVVRNASQTLLCAALLELAGSVALYEGHIVPFLREGMTVIEESFGFKHVLKNVLMARRACAERSAVDVAARGLLEMAKSLFAEHLAPNLGCWIDTDPALALRWRTVEGIAATAFEDYGLIGARSDESFIEMQCDCRRGFADAAAAWNWQRVAMLDRTKDENVGSAVDAIVSAMRTMVVDTTAGGMATWASIHHSGVRVSTRMGAVISDDVSAEPIK